MFIMGHFIVSYIYQYNKSNFSDKKIPAIGFGAKCSKEAGCSDMFALVCVEVDIIGSMP